MDFVELEIGELQFNPFEMIGTDWMLITAGNESAYNTMTASWGEMGYLWGQPVANIHVRPQRYTKEFIDQTDDFTLCFFGPSYRDALAWCGEHSGREGDKAIATGLTPVELDGSIAFEEAELIFVCHKLYAQQIDPECFVDKDIIDECYPERDFHTTYVGRVERVLISEDLLEEAGEDDECGCGHDHEHEHGESCGCGCGCE